MAGAMEAPLIYLPNSIAVNPPVAGAVMISLRADELPPAAILTALILLSIEVIVGAFNIVSVMIALLSFLTSPLLFRSGPIVAAPFNVSSY